MQYRGGTDRGMLELQAANATTKNDKRRKSDEQRRRENERWSVRETKQKQKAIAAVECSVWEHR